MLFGLIKSKKDNYPVKEHNVKYAFTCGGVDYYQFESFNMMPALRGLKTMVFYEEMRMKCTMEYLQLHVAAIDEILKSNKIDIYQIKKFNDQMKQRLDIALDTEILMKLASVVFFDMKENIEDYDFVYNKKKIASWKEHFADAFFLLTPVQELLPPLKDMNENLTDYSRVVTVLNNQHLENLLQVLPAREIQRLRNK